MTDIAESPTGRKDMRRMTEEDHKVAKEILQSGALEEALLQLDAEDLEIQHRELEARQRKPN